MPTKLTLFLGNTIGVKYVGFQEIPSNGSRDTAVKLLCFPCKVHCTNCDRWGVSGKCLECQPKHYRKPTLFTL